MSATAADVRNGLKTRKVIARKNPSDLTVSLAGHRFVEEASHLGMLCQIAPRASGCNLVDGHFTGVHRVPEQLKALPTDGITGSSGQTIAATAGDRCGAAATSAYAPTRCHGGR